MIVDLATVHEQGPLSFAVVPGGARRVEQCQGDLDAAPPIAGRRRVVGAATGFMVAAGPSSVLTP